MPRVFLATAVLSLGVWASSASAAQPIEGDWKTASGETARITACDGRFCVTVVTGRFKDRRIGVLSGAGAAYKGTITDPKDNKTYDGYAAVTGATLKLKGCALKIFCQIQTWTRP